MSGSKANHPLSTMSRDNRSAGGTIGSLRAYRETHFIAGNTFHDPVLCPYHCKIRINERRFERNKNLLLPSKDNVTPNPLSVELIDKFMLVQDRS